jgi:ketosteroid isomerase-like protein
MSLNSNKAIIRKMFEVINNQNLASLDELMAPNFVMNMNAQHTQGWKTGRQIIRWLKAFPDLKSNRRTVFLRFENSFIL